MHSILEAESARLLEQERLDRLKTDAERNRWGQFATPPALSLEIAQYAWARLKGRKGTFSFLDPAIGSGSFFSALLQTFPRERIARPTGIDLDPVFARAAKDIWRTHGLQVIEGDFTTQAIPKAVKRFDIILTNPPYVRHHHLDLSDKQRLAEAVFSLTGLRLSGLAGLYCYFLLIAHAWLAEHGLAIWLIPAEFMDVNYGEEVKRYLTERVSLLHIHRFCPSDVQFDDALVSSAIVVFEKERPKPDHDVLFSFGGNLVNPANAEAVSLTELRETRKWSSFARRRDNGRVGRGVVLGDLFQVKRGIATGRNSFFILPKRRLRELGIPLECVRPILPSPRFLKLEIIEDGGDGWPRMEEPLGLIDCQLSEEEISRRYPRFWSYLESGKKAGIAKGYLTSRRAPWYSQEKRDVAPFLCTYMGRSCERPFRFVWNKSQAIAANVYLLLYPRQSVLRRLRADPGLWDDVFRALRSIQPAEFFSEGRVYGGGLHKMEPAELMRLPADEIAGVFGLQRQQQLSMF